MSDSRTNTIKLVVAGVIALAALALLFGPRFVEPTHPKEGIPYTQLPAAHPDHVAPGGPQRALGIFVLCLGLWVTDLIPLAATSLLAIALLPLLGVMSHNQAFAYFGNSAVFFILGVFILAAAMIDTGLSKRLTLKFLHWFDRTPGRLVGGVLVCGSFFSLWMPEHAVAAMMFPIVLEIAEALNLRRPGSPYARSLFLALAWGPVVGGVGTYLGGARAVLAVEILRKFHPDAATPSFLAYAATAMPLVIILTAAAFYIITVGTKREIDSIAPATRMLTDRVRLLGPLSGRERRLAVLAILTVLAWIIVPQVSGPLLGYRVELGVIAVVSAVMVFVLRIVKWNSIQDYVNWGVLVMYGGAVALGAALADTHAMDWLATQLVPYLAANKLALLTVVAIVAVIFTEGMSNAAVVAMLLPLGLGLCGTLHVSPMAMMYMVTLPAGLGFCLPMGAPAIAIAFSSGYYGVGQVVARGMLMNILAVLVLVLCAWLYWPLIGLRL
ncbi:MAG TPA: DASS family sodium-coupled anion symporter [Phycisphaerae bacterium]|nr:DASS family sodium-coupled anion symporter [Phycisphaerae bacterium]